MSIEEIADAISAGKATRSMASELREYIKAGLGLSILTPALLDDARAGSHSSTIDLVMHSLEKLAEIDGPAACCLMIRILPLANDMLRHDVWDAIHLWLWDCSDPFFLSELKKEIETEADGSLSRFYREIITRNTVKGGGA